ncbi:uncharacterized protein I303_100626 [Kwoniella dejecticola CBS 10117]|uniref:Uncharacterized protein n=1 Tax=Kwoniella dejecticola CBS 10117 TaxID=1296121 RepID=A0A1A6AFF9_9TREE|nr:uncharacterized protein I303_00629 [Kwoniella dejecticola CBS 10117]OBR88812.1 hypothetical protein I303_00629 [Kwoniella dejecticola CBS 10117]
MSSDTTGTMEPIYTTLGGMPSIPAYDSVSTEPLTDEQAKEILLANGRGKVAQRLGLTASYHLGCSPDISSFLPTSTLLDWSDEEDQCRRYLQALENRELILNGSSKDTFFNPNDENFYELAHSQIGARLPLNEASKEVLEHWGRLPDVPDDVHEGFGFPDRLAWEFMEDESDDLRHSLADADASGVATRIGAITVITSPYLRLPEERNWGENDRSITWGTPISLSSQAGIDFHLQEECEGLTINQDDTFSFYRDVAIAYSRAAQKYARTRIDENSASTASASDWSWATALNLGAAGFVVPVDEYDCFPIGGVDLTLKDQDNHPVEVKLRWLGYDTRSSSAEVPGDAGSDVLLRPTHIFGPGAAHQEQGASLDSANSTTASTKVC